MDFFNASHVIGAFLSYLGESLAGVPASFWDVMRAALSAFEKNAQIAADGGGV
jgi:hypothetical protein